MAKKKTSNIGRVVVKFIIILIAIAILYFGGTYAYKTGYGIIGNSASSNEAVDVVVTIPQGASTKTIAKILKDNNLITSTLYFRYLSKSSGNDGKFQFGDFTLNASMEEEEIMDLLMTGGQKRETVKFTIPEGFTIQQIADKLEAEGIVDSDEFINVTQNKTFNYKFLENVPVRNTNLQGYLFPDTYEIYKDATAEDIVVKMLDKFDQVFKDEYYTRAEELGLSVDEIITMASIIEREVRVDSERKKVAGVIYNRLEIDMKLEMCSTVIYALDKPKDFNKNKLLYSDLETDSPYNTYMYPGLPVGPIANPGEASIVAALYPEEHDYLFFVLVNEETGEHEFNKTLNEHNAAKNQYNQQY